MPKTICRFSMCFSVFQSHFIVVLFQLNYAIFFLNFVCLICFLCYANHRFDLSFQQSQDVAYTSMLSSSFYDKSTDGNVHGNVFDYVFFYSDSYFLMMSILIITFLTLYFSVIEVTTTGLGPEKMYMECLPLYSKFIMCLMKVVYYFPSTEIVVVQFMPTSLNHTSGMYTCIFF